MVCRNKRKKFIINNYIYYTQTYIYIYILYHQIIYICTHINIIHITENYYISKTAKRNKYV